MQITIIHILTPLRKQWGSRFDDVTPFCVEYNRQIILRVNKGVRSERRDKFLVQKYNCSVQYNTASSTILTTCIAQAHLQR